MDRRNKALEQLRGVPLLRHVLDRFAPQCTKVAISANCDRERLGRFGHPILRDPIDGFPGPLAGVLAGLEWAIEVCPSAVFLATAPVDTPLLPKDLVARLIEAAAHDSRRPVCATSGGRRHSVAALWPLSMAAGLRHVLTDGREARVSAILDRADCVEVTWPVGRYDPFLNVNTPEDLVTAGTLVGASDSS